MSNGDSFSFSNNVTGGTAQINQGQNVTATQTNTGTDPWQEAIDAAQEIDSEQVAADVIEIKELSQGDDNAQAATISERVRTAAPGVLKLVAAAVLKGPQGLAAEAILQVAKKLE